MVDNGCFCWIEVVTGKSGWLLFCSSPVRSLRLFDFNVYVLDFRFFRTFFFHFKMLIKRLEQWRKFGESIDPGIKVGLALVDQYTDRRQRRPSSFICYVIY